MKMDICDSIKEKDVVHLENIVHPENTVHPEKNIDKNTEMKCHEGDRLFVGCYDGSVLELSMNQNNIVNELVEILYGMITSMAKTYDNKS